MSTNLNTPLSSATKDLLDALESQQDPLIEEQHELLPLGNSTTEELKSTSADMYLMKESSKTKASRRQYVSSFISNICVFMAGCTMGWPSATVPLLLSKESPIPMDGPACSWMISLMYFGNMFSPLPCGILMDRIGRKNTLIILNVIPLTSWSLIYFTRSVIYLYIARFLAGLWLGIIYTVVPIYLGEIAEPRIRGSLSTYFSLMTYVGVLFQYIIGPYVSYSTLALCSGAACIIFYSLSVWMPESPYFLLKVGRKEEAKANLSWLRGDATNVNEILEEMDSSIQKQLQNRGTILDLVNSKGNRKAFIIVSILSLFQRCSGIGVMIAYTSITLPKDALKPLGNHECVIIMGAVWVVSTFVFSFLIDRFDRRTLLILSAIGCGVATFVVGLWFFFQQTRVDVESLGWIVFPMFLIHALFYSFGLNPVVTTIKGEVFSANIKGVASAITTQVLAFSSFLLNKSYQPINDTVGVYVNYWFYTFCSLMAVVFTWGYVLETRGKSLQQIQEELNSEN